jgi:hypothetical protein
MIQFNAMFPISEQNCFNWTTFFSAVKKDVKVENDAIFF